MTGNAEYSEGFANNNGVKIFYRDYGPVGGDPAVSYTHLTLPTILLV